MPIISKAIYRDVFNLHEERAAALERCRGKDLTAYWAETTDMMIGVSSKHGQSLLCVELLVAVHADLERQAKGR